MQQQIRIQDLENIIYRTGTWQAVAVPVEVMQGQPWQVEQSIVLPPYMPALPSTENYATEHAQREHSVPEIYCIAGSGRPRVSSEGSDSADFN